MSTATNPDFVEAIASAVAQKLQLGTSRTRRLLTVEDASEYLALSRKSIHELLANRRLAGVRFGRKTMLDIKDLDEWIEKNKA